MPPRQVTRQTLVNDSYRGIFAIRRGDWKLIESQHGGGAGTQNIPFNANKPAGQLYHLDRDLAESINQYERHSELVESLAARLQEYRRSGRSAPTNRSRSL